MERLTNDNGELIKCKDSFCAAVCARHRTCNDCPVAQAFNRLAEYERTGVTPEQIKEVDRLYLEKCQEVNQYQQKEDATVKLFRENAVYLDIESDVQFVELKEAIDIVKGGI